MACDSETPGRPAGVCLSADFTTCLEKQFGRGTGRIRVRNLRYGEELPPELDTGFNATLDRDWVWIAESDCDIQAVLLAAPFHGCAHLGRVVARPGASTLVLTVLLRWVLRELKARGLRGFIAWLEKGEPTCERLLHAVKSAKGFVEEKPHVLVGASLDVEEDLIRCHQR
jgi:hypothetical protein